MLDVCIHKKPNWRFMFGFTWFPRPIVTAIRDLDCMAGEVNRT